MFATQVLLIRPIFQTSLTIHSEKDEKRNVSIVSFIIQGIDSHNVAKALDRGNVSVRGGHHCAMPLVISLGVSGVCRASFYVYNNTDDIDALVLGIKKAKKLFKNK